MEGYFWKHVEPEKIDAVDFRDALVQKHRMNLKRRTVITERGAPENIEKTDVVEMLLECCTYMYIHHGVKASPRRFLISSMEGRGGVLSAWDYGWKSYKLRFNDIVIVCCVSRRFFKFTLCLG